MGLPTMTSTTLEIHKLMTLNCASSTTTTSHKPPKKRKRREPAKPSDDVVDVSSKQAKMAKAVEGKDPKTVQDSVSPLKVRSGNDSLFLENVKHSDKANQQPKNITSPKSKAAGSSSALHLKCIKSVHQQSNSMPGKSRPNVLGKSTVVRQKENDGMNDQDNATISRQSNQITKKGGSNVKHKTSTLEKAFGELEKVVAECCVQIIAARPPAVMDNQDDDTACQAVKRRLPGDVKLKLAKVARIAQASQGNLSVELINRLMNIVGHLIQVRSLKRNLKIMIDSGDSAKRENDTRFQSIKNEVIEMFKTRVPDWMKIQVHRSESFMQMLMDNHGIKRAICRAKERRRALHANHGKEMEQGKTTKRKHTELVPKSDGTACPDKAASVGDKTTCIVPSATTTSLVHTQPSIGSSRDKTNQKHEKLKGSSSSSDPSG